MRLLSLAVVLVISFSHSVMAQGLFSPAIEVDDQVITYYEIRQRAALMKVLGVKGDLTSQARDALVGDKLKVSAARAAGIVATEAQVQAAIDTLAGRNNRTAAQMLSDMASAGIAEETIRDFVTANSVWQDLMRARFTGAIDVRDSDIDAALAATSDATNLQVLVSEIVLPLIEGQETEIRKLANDIAALRSFDEFSDAARQFSVARTRANGGKLDWISLSNLPPALRPVILPLKPGEVSQPLDLPNAIALFQMRGLSESTPKSTRYATVSYATIEVSEAEVPQAVDTLTDVGDRALRCDDLYGLSEGIPHQGVIMKTLPPSDVPKRDGIWLARLDAGEYLVDRVTGTNGGTHAKLVMLCSRTSVANKSTSREEVKRRLQNEKLNARANSELESLRASARIKYH